jgi:hypothetical protein
MLRFECDTCQRLKGADEAWILGFAAENVGAVSIRREINIASSWDPTRALDALAVHFCSDSCRVTYTESLFGDRVAPVVEAVEVVPVAERTVAVTPAQVTVQSTKRKISKVKRKRRPAA